MKKHLATFSLTLLLAACGGGLPKPVSLSPLKTAGGWFRLEERDAGGGTVQNSLLAVEQGAGGIRFVQTDPLGAPLARQVLDAEGWRNDGFIMPNAPARRLFAAMLPLLAADAGAVYPDVRRSPSAAGGECYSRRGKTLWCAARADGGWLLTFPGQRQWAVVPIQE